jgi:hypothetical protein
MNCARPFDAGWRVANSAYTRTGLGSRVLSAVTALPRRIRHSSRQHHAITALDWPMGARWLLASRSVELHRPWASLALRDVRELDAPDRARLRQIAQGYARSRKVTPDRARSRQVRPGPAPEGPVDEDDGDAAGGELAIIDDDDPVHGVLASALDTTASWKSPRFASNGSPSTAASADAASADAASADAASADAASAEAPLAFGQQRPELRPVLGSRLLAIHLHPPALCRNQPRCRRLPRPSPGGRSG